MKGRLVACYGLLLSLVPMPFAIACHRSRPRFEVVTSRQTVCGVERTDSPGCAVGISRNGEIVYEHGYGMANLELGVPITPDTVFPIASISKAFTAMSVMLAVQQGKLSLDDEVQKFIPEWKDREDHITIRHLLSHTSGIRDAFTLLGWAPAGYAGDTERGDRENTGASARTQFRARYQVRVQQRRLRPDCEHPQTRDRPVARRVRRRQYFQTVGYDALASSARIRQRSMPNRASGYTRQVDGWHLVLDAKALASSATAGCTRPSATY